MIENAIISNLILNEEYVRKVLPFLKLDYFQDKGNKILCNVIKEFILKYKSIPSKAALKIEIEQNDKLDDEEIKNCFEVIDNSKEKEPKLEWLIDSTEKFCKERAIHLALLESIKLVENKEKANVQSIPSILSDALSVSFNQTIGHDFIEDHMKRYDLYHKVETKIPFDLEEFNLITSGGLNKKTLNVILAGTGVGKTLCMCHMAASHLLSGYNVLYITLEMAEEKISERIDSNVLGVDINKLKNIEKNDYGGRFEKLKKRKAVGKLIVKEYPTATANSLHFRNLIQELKIKKNFHPDILYIDYINICSSSRVKPGINTNLYQFVKSIAEELRGLAVEYDLPIITATQTTRSGYTNTDPDLDDTSESFGLPATADFMVGLVVTNELLELNQIMVKQLKNRYNDPNYHKKFLIGVDRKKMKLYNLDNSGGEENEPEKIKPKTKEKSKFEDFKYE